MRRYETMVILADSLDEPDATARFDAIKGIVAEQQGNVVDEAWWGLRELAYEIDKRTHGWYGVLDLEIGTEGLAEFERQLKLSDDVVRFKTVRPDIRVTRAS
ncbi:MAG: 30S ribosomal protein S6 [Nitriliruptorales bacterium]|nr:30S ribosomal protein S6 [Nitriliruptorales bacterium]